MSLVLNEIKDKLDMVILATKYAILWTLCIAASIIYPSISSDQWLSSSKCYFTL